MVQAGPEHVVASPTGQPSPRRGLPLEGRAGRLEGMVQENDLAAVPQGLADGRRMHARFGCHALLLSLCSPPAHRP